MLWHKMQWLNGAGAAIHSNQRVSTQTAHVDNGDGCEESRADPLTFA